MAKVIFSIQYEIEADKKDEYLGIIKELKNLINAEGLEEYSVYELKGKKNHFQELYKFNSMEAFEAFDDDENERLNILINKLNSITVNHSTKYTTMQEISVE